MEYYRELFFAKVKHSYELNQINFYSDNIDDVVRYINVPAKGFKFLSTGLLDPVTGYIFKPSNFFSFKEKIIFQNKLKNGVCVSPIIFEYIKDGSFYVHLYSDVIDNLVEVSIKNKVSLSESKPGTLLRSVEDESYYLYLGLVGQFYVDEYGNNGVVRKKHLVLKTDYLNNNNAENDVILHVKHFHYVDFTKDKKQVYLQVKHIEKENLKVQHYYGTNINLGEYIHNDQFEVYDFQKDYPSLLLSPTTRFVFKKSDISLTRNNVRLHHDYVGEADIKVSYDVDFNSKDTAHKSLHDVFINRKLFSTSHPDIDFQKNNYSIEVDGLYYLISPSCLLSSHETSPSLRIDLDIFAKYAYQTDFMFYLLDNVSVVSRRKLYNLQYNSPTYKKPVVDRSKKIKLYKTSYVLNNHNHYNIFYPEKTNSCDDRIESLVVNESSIFDDIKKNGNVSFSIFG